MPPEPALPRAIEPDKAPVGPEPERQQLEREWAEAVQRAMRKGPMPPEAENPSATKKGRRAT